MKLEDFPEPMVEALCAWNWLRNWGFSASDIFFRACKHASGAFPIIELRLDGGIDGGLHSYWLGIVRGATPEALIHQWREMGKLLQTLSSEELYRAWTRTRMYQEKGLIIARMKRAGVVIPKVHN
jgi:hypothetical protein